MSSADFGVSAQSNARVSLCRTPNGKLSLIGGKIKAVVMFSFRGSGKESIDSSTRLVIVLSISAEYNSNL
ncbi:MAG: hypothetical protein KME57_18095 [Scytonema hyalinum WJT4-NPBG1]|nr:hypothetical protein [Scytonema hyalinum WJT4-NPBG1]